MPDERKCVSSQGQTDVSLALNSKKKGSCMWSFPQKHRIRLTQNFPKLTPDRSRGLVLNMRVFCRKEGG